VACVVLLSFFPDSIDAYDAMRDYTFTSEYGGIEVLFMLNSGLLGWVICVLVERKVDETTFILALTSSLWCLVLIGGGFALTSLFVGNLTGPMWEMLVLSMVFSVGTSTFQSYFGDLL